MLIDHDEDQVLAIDLSAGGRAMRPHLRRVDRTAARRHGPERRVIIVQRPGRMASAARGPSAGVVGDGVR
ncbi:MAG: hypothetical protein HS111_13010 [Kofleriaceae bacterium]|nr:hypothetical protein [Kofleriaceae bacterium]